MIDVNNQIGLFAAALSVYLQSRLEDYFTGVNVGYGKKFARVSVGCGGQNFAYCFIDMSNGDILKAASWKVPAKGKRGSIFNPGFDIGDDKPCDAYGGGLYRRG